MFSYPPPSEPIDPQHLILVRDFVVVLTEAVKATADQFESAHAVTGLEAQVLRMLYTPGELTVKQIAAELIGIPSSTLTRVLDSLEEQKAITRRINVADRRSFIISLTDHGRAIVRSYLEAMAQVATLMLGGLTAAERMIMLELMRKMEAYQRASG